LVLAAVIWLLASAIFGAATVSNVAVAMPTAVSNIVAASSRIAAGASEISGVNGINDVAWVCGPYRCWWRPNNYYYNYHRAPEWFYFWRW
jgi:hypothetical protein